MGSVITRNKTSREFSRLKHSDTSEWKDHQRQELEQRLQFETCMSLASGCFANIDVAMKLYNAHSLWTNCHHGLAIVMLSVVFIVSIVSFSFSHATSKRYKREFPIVELMLSLTLLAPLVATLRAATQLWSHDFNHHHSYLKWMGVAQGAIQAPLLFMFSLYSVFVGALPLTWSSVPMYSLICSACCVTFNLTRLDVYGTDMNMSASFLKHFFYTLLRRFSEVISCAMVISFVSACKRPPGAAANETSQIVVFPIILMIFVNSYEMANMLARFYKFGVVAFISCLMICSSPPLLLPGAAKMVPAWLHRQAMLNILIAAFLVNDMWQTYDAPVQFNYYLSVTDIVMNHRGLIGVGAVFTLAHAIFIAHITFTGIVLVKDPRDTLEYAEETMNEPLQLIIQQYIYSQQLDTEKLSQLTVYGHLVTQRSVLKTWHNYTIGRIESQLSESERAELTASLNDTLDRDLEHLLELMDANLDQSLDSSELPGVLRCLGICANMKEVHDMIEEYDPDHDCKLNVAEFRKAAKHRLQQRDLVTDLLRVFHNFDRQYKNTISEEDIQNVARETHMHLTPDDVRKMLLKASGLPNKMHNLFDSRVRVSVFDGSYRQYQEHDRQNVIPSNGCTFYQFSHVMALSPTIQALANFANYNNP